MQNNLYTRSLELHQQLQGKIRVVSAAPIKTRDDLSLVYTPGVAAVSSRVAEHPEEARLYTGKGRMIAVISDGSAVLGLGNIGPLGALPVMEGKAAIFKEFADIDAFPIVLATQDTDAIVETICNIAPGFGGINLEDFSAPRCFEIERRVQERLDIPVMHDDQHGTAIVVLAALINAARVVKKDFSKLRVVISGAGAAGSATAYLLAQACIKDIVILDSKGAICSEREDMTPHKVFLNGSTNPRGVCGGLTEALAGADVFIGMSGPNVLKAEQVRLMAEHAIVFALANPVPEITPEEALAGGAAIVGTGRSDYPNQINNALVFPGVFRGALDSGAKRITDDMKINAARALAELVPDPTAEKFIPGIFEKEVVTAVARAVRDAAEGTVRSRAF